MAHCAMLTNTIKITDNNKKTSDCPLFISQYITAGPNGERLKYIKFLCINKKEKFFRKCGVIFYCGSVEEISDKNYWTQQNKAVTL